MLVCCFSHPAVRGIELEFGVLVLGGNPGVAVSMESKLAWWTENGGFAEAWLNFNLASFTKTNSKFSN
jgi:hypothetical protein